MTAGVASGGGGSPFPKALAFAALTLVVVLGIATAREVTLGRDAVAAADAASSRSDWLEAIAQARSAAEAYAPGSPWPERGLRRLEAIGHDAEARGDDDTALIAYGAMRTAAIETQAPGSTSTRWRRAAEEALARVAAARRETPHVSAESMLRALQQGETPSTWTLALLGVAVAAMAVGLGRLAAGDAAGRVERLSRGAVAAGFAVYALTLWMIS